MLEEYIDLTIVDHEGCIDRKFLICTIPLVNIHV